MKRIALVAGAVIATVVGSASAQVYYQRPYDAYPRIVDQECWNPRAGHYEGVRPGEVQNDLDFSRCRALGMRHDHERLILGERRYPWQGREPERQLYRDSSRGFSTECWNPREERWDVLHPGEIQDNLDKNRCRPNRHP
jgi:hypothetical protein